MTFWKYMEFRGVEALMGLGVLIVVVLVAALIAVIVDDRKRRRGKDS